MLTNQHVVQAADPRIGGDSQIVIQPNYALGDGVPGGYRCGDYVDGYRDPHNDCALVHVGYGRSWVNEIPERPMHYGHRRLRGTRMPLVHDIHHRPYLFSQLQQP